MLEAHRASGLVRLVRRRDIAFGLSEHGFFSGVGLGGGGLFVFVRVRAEARPRAPRVATSGRDFQRNFWSFYSILMCVFSAFLLFLFFPSVLEEEKSLSISFHTKKLTYLKLPAGSTPEVTFQALNLR